MIRLKQLLKENKAKIYTINGFDDMGGMLKKPKKVQIFVRDNGDRTWWFTIKGTKSYKLTNDKLKNGVNVGDLNIVNAGARLKSINTLDDFEELWRSEYY